MVVIKKFRIKNFKKKNILASFEDVSISFGQRQILDNINFNINSGEIIGLLGPNGAGKSTIFNLLIGLLKPDFGKIYIENINVTNSSVSLRAKKFKIGYVPQYGGYFHDLTHEIDSLKKTLRRYSILEDEKELNDYIQKKFIKIDKKFPLIDEL